MTNPFTHAKVRISTRITGKDLPSSGSLIVSQFFYAFEDPSMRSTYEAAGIEEVGMPIIGYLPREGGERAEITITCWVYGTALVGGRIAPALAATFKLVTPIDFQRESFTVTEIGPWKLHATDIRMGVHRQKKKYRTDGGPVDEVKIVRGFYVDNMRGERSFGGD